MDTPVLGIDLGTTNSVVATVNDAGRVDIVPNPRGSETTPSVVYFEDDGTALIGDDAKQALAFDSANGVALIKRRMGKDFPIDIRGERHTPESISALILRYLVKFDGTGSAPYVVITVPAYFGTGEKEATFQAGSIAGLHVLELLAEPVAAAGHYGLSARGDSVVLVYDLGGGTFDTSVLKVHSRGISVVATDGHRDLGGADIDRGLLDISLQRLSGLVGDDEFNAFVDDEGLLGGLLLDLESVKKDLTKQRSKEFTVHCSRHPVRLAMTRQDLERSCANLLEATGVIVERLIETARQEGVRGIDEVIMVGGSSRLPAIQPQLEELTGVAPMLIEPDLAVAKGAALRAHRLVESPQMKALSAAQQSRGLSIGGDVDPVASRSIGVLVHDSFDPQGSRSFVQHLLRANSRLPATATSRSFGTILDGQDTVRIQILEQAGTTESSEVGDNRLVLDGELKEIPYLSAGSVIELTLELSRDGRLSVTAREPLSGKELHLEAFMEGVIDTAEAGRLSSLVSGIQIRG